MMASPAALTDSPHDTESTPYGELPVDDITRRCAEKNLDLLSRGVMPLDSAVISVLRDANMLFMERAAISEIDGGLARRDAETLALEEIVVEWWQNLPAHSRPDAPLWGNVRRLAFKSLLAEVARR